MAVTRGFSGRRSRDHRLPPGQYDAGDQWPVLYAEATPSIDVAGWTFTLDSLVSTVLSLVRRPARRAMPVPRSAVRLSMSPSV